MCRFLRRMVVIIADAATRLVIRSTGW